MLKQIFLVSLFLGCIVGLPTFIYHSHELDDMNSLTFYNFYVFTQKYGKVYDNPDEHHLRYNIFAENMEKISEWNEGDHNFTLAINEYADMTQQEFSNHFLTLHQLDSNRLKNIVHRNTFSLPDTVDWREKGVVNKIKDQGQCGSCYAFSAVQAIESAWAIKNGKLFSLAEQEIVDCDKVDSGCNGGLMDNVFNWVIQNGGLVQTDDYVYHASENTCKVDKTKSVVQIKSLVDVPAGNSTQLEAAVAEQPVSVAINANSYQFQFYHKGVFDWTGCPNKDSDLDHGVGIVGYGNLNGTNYWIVRNSWSENWGDSGYILMARGEGVNTCGILDAASYPLV
jgi:KDEL-tailed cysteine endopeptidase